MLTFKNLVERLGRLPSTLGRPAVVGIGGGECVGKTQLARQVVQSLRNHGVSAVVIGMDGYLKYSRSERQKVAGRGTDLASEAFRIGDHPSCFNLEELRRDIKTLIDRCRLAHRRSYSYRDGQATIEPEPIEIDSSGVVIVEGILCLCPELTSIYDLAIFLHASAPIVRGRYLARHLSRGQRSAAEICAMFDNVVLPVYKAFIEPTRVSASVIGSCDGLCRFDLRGASEPLSSQ